MATLTSLFSWKSWIWSQRGSWWGSISFHDNGNFLISQNGYGRRRLNLLCYGKNFIKIESPINWLQKVIAQRKYTHLLFLVTKLLILLRFLDCFHHFSKTLRTIIFTYHSGNCTRWVNLIASALTAWGLELDLWGQHSAN